MENRFRKYTVSAISQLYGEEIDQSLVQLQETRNDFEGDLTLVVFPYLRFSKKPAEQTGEDIGKWLKENAEGVESFSVIKGFLNIVVRNSEWLELFKDIAGSDNYGFSSPAEDSPVILVEYSSPNTNKPLHLGHIRNNLLGYSLARILEANGNNVCKTNIVNDRGIHICKSMVAWKRFGNGETPDKKEEKGDHLVGRYYVKFNDEYNREIDSLVAEGMTREEASEKAPVLEEAREMLRGWEAGDKEIRELWERMNSWVYKGFDETYRSLGVSFDKIYYESETYKHGKRIVEEALNREILYKKEDGSVWADLTGDGLDHKILLRSDGTAVYMTQDLGTAVDRYEDYKFDKQVYVVGNEQNYHFQVLKLILKKLGYSWFDRIYHFNYGMVELPSGKMKSREGTVVDADELVETMYETAREMSEELGKLGDDTNTDKEMILRKIGLGALKYYILKVDPKKNMLFNPKESIDFNGNTGPFIQYTYTRINSILRKAGKKKECVDTRVEINKKEKDIIRRLSVFPSIVREAGITLSPSLIANYCYDLAKEFNQFYHDYTILGEKEKQKRDFRIELSFQTGYMLKNGMWLLGIDLPEKM